MKASQTTHLPSELFHVFVLIVQSPKKSPVKAVETHVIGASKSLRFALSHPALLSSTGPGSSLAMPRVCQLFLQSSDALQKGLEPHLGQGWHQSLNARKKKIERLQDVLSTLRERARETEAEFGK